ncbi:hypothetical protein HK097_003789, partial [Rhizophlyctis rosea]
MTPSQPDAQPNSPIPTFTLLPPPEDPNPSPTTSLPSPSIRRQSIDSGYTSRDTDHDSDHFNDNASESSPLLSPRRAETFKKRKHPSNPSSGDNNSRLARLTTRFNNLVSYGTGSHGFNKTAGRNWDDDSVHDEGPLKSSSTGSQDGCFKRTWTTIKNRLPASDVLVVLWTLFIIEASRGLVLPTMYTYVVQTGGDVGTLGICVSLYSVGRLVCSVPFGTWADKRKSSREVLIWTSVLAVLGNTLYAFAPWGMSGYVSAKVVLGILCASRLVVGFGTGSLSVCKAYLAANSPQEERTKVIAWSGMAQYAGFSLTPGLATLLMYIEGSYTPPNPTPTDSTDDNGPTFLACILPGIALAIANLLLIPMLISGMPARDPVTESPVLKPSPPPPVQSSPSSVSVDSNASGDTLIDGLPNQQNERVETDPAQLPSPVLHAKKHQQTEDKIVKWGFIVFFFLNFVLRGIIGVTETLAPEMYQHLRSDQEDALEESGRFFFYLGLAGLVIFALVDPIQKRFLKGDHLLVFGTFCVALGTLLNLDPKPAQTPASFDRFVAGMVLT